MKFNPIGYFKCDLQKKYEAPHQATGDETQTGVIELDMGPLTRQAVEDLKGFDRIWLIFVFHQAQTAEFKAKVQPPRHATTKKSFLATRSPHRFNPIGLTAAKLEKIDGTKVYVTEADLLDGTPILDIKPYLASYDSFPEAKSGWLDSEPLDEWKIIWTTEALGDLAFLGNEPTLRQKDHSDHSPLLKHFSDLEKFEDIVEKQLRYRPFDRHRHRIKWDPKNCTGTLAISHWRIGFRYSDEQRTFWIETVILD